MTKNNPDNPGNQTITFFYKIYIANKNYSNKL